MKNIEKELFFELCRYCQPNKDKISRLLEKGAATSEVLGELFYNRMAAVAYGVLRDMDLIDKVNREFRNSLYNAYLQNVEKNKSFFSTIKMLYNILETCGAPYAMLKGAFLCAWYPEGYRTSNDIDILVHQKDLTIVGKALTENGFKQGYIRNDNFIPATRQQIIESRMMRGETVPYIKEVGLPFMRFLEVDINFSLDYQNSGSDTVKDIIGHAVNIELKGIPLRVPERHDFFLHLCSHLYKEATTYPWVVMHRDMTLYKYLDIYTLIYNMPFDFDAISDRARQYGLCGPCAFTMWQTDALFGIDHTLAELINYLFSDVDYDIADRVISPADKRVYRYIERNIIDRFFAKNRASLLEDITYEETQNV